MKEEFDPVSKEEYERRARRAVPLSEEELAILQEEAGEFNVPNFYEKLGAEGDPHTQELMRQAIAVAEAVNGSGGLALVVGGYTRDAVLERMGYDVDPKDIDIEVYGLDLEKLKSLLGGIGELNIVGESFGVIKLGALDISIPRVDSKTGRGHKGFTISGDPFMNVTEASRRRDFTINAMLLNPLTGEIIDKHGGLKDAKNKIIRATDPELFKDDPLRVLRAAQFAGRFGFDIDEDTVELCRGVDLRELPKERVGEEWYKLLLKSADPGAGLEAARTLGVIERLHPEFWALAGVPQAKVWHPEGDVWTHTKLAVDAAAGIAREENLGKDPKLVLMLAALCHDLGKSTTTKITKDGKITSLGHADAGLEPAKSFLRAINASQTIAERVLPLVREHTFLMSAKDPGDAAVRRLAGRLAPATIYELSLVMRADKSGRGLPDDGSPEIRKLLADAERLAVDKNKLQPIILGRDLIATGFRPGPTLGEILKSVYAAQVEGMIKTKTEALQFAEELKKKLEEAGATVKLK